MSLKIKLFYALLIGLLILSFWPFSDNEREEGANIRIWNAKIDDSGQLNVMGVVLGKSTLKEAETALRSQSERALFIKSQDEAVTSETIEAFFPTSPDRAKIIIELDVPAELLTQIKARAYKPMAFPSGNIKLEIAPEDNAALEALPARSLTYIPPIALDAAMIEQNFGPAAQRISDADANLHLLYPALGLDAVLPPDGKALLQFVPPQQFERLLRLLPDPSP